MKAVPVTFSYFHSLDFETEYSVGLKSTSNGAAVDLELRLGVLAGRGHHDLDAVVDDLDRLGRDRVLEELKLGPVHLTG